MSDLMRKRPQDFWLGELLAQTRKSAPRTIWTRPDPGNLMRAFSDSEKRLIRTAGDLRAILVESIRRFESTLHGAPPSLELWNHPKDGKETIWSPKDEHNLSNCLKLHFDRDLERRGIFASREVKIRPPLGSEPGQLVDVLVTAVPFMEDGKPGKAVSVVVEVKCDWNSGVLEDMKGQIYQRYLANNEYDFGIYVVAYFTCASWRRSSAMSIDDLGTTLRAQDEQLSSSEKRVEALVIDARITTT